MLLVQAHWNCIALHHGQNPCPHIPQMHEVLGFWTSTDFWLDERDVTLTLIYRSRETKKVISPLPVTATSPPPVIATDADAVYDSSHHFKRPGCFFPQQLGELCGDPKVIVDTNINPKLIGGRLFLNATSGTHIYFDKETSAGVVLFYQLLARDTGLPSAAPLLRGYAKVEPLKIADLNNFIVTAPTQIRDGVMVIALNAVGNCSAVSAFTFVRCANPHAVEALRCPSLCCCVEMAIADDTAEGIFVWFDGVTMKLHNLRARLVEEGVNPKDTGLPPFIADMEGKTYTFQVRVTAYNFTEHHKTFTITHIVDEIDRVPLLDVADDVSILCVMMFRNLDRHVYITDSMYQWDDGDDDDDKPAVKPLPVEVQSGGISGNAHKKTVDSTSNVFKKTRVARYGVTIIL
ncbi:unnamed protein product [Brassica oleracea var. botrytis]